MVYFSMFSTLFLLPKEPFRMPDSPKSKPAAKAAATEKPTAATSASSTSASTASQTAKELRVQELLTELEGKSETTQRPVIDEIVQMGPTAINPLARA
jgi:hypothetical protein